MSGIKKANFNKIIAMKFIVSSSSLLKHLQQKRVSPINIKAALKAIDLDDYQKTLQQLALKKWNSLKGERGLSRMAKTQAFLHQRGFEPDLFRPIVQALYNG